MVSGQVGEQGKMVAQDFGTQRHGIPAEMVPSVQTSIVSLSKSVWLPTRVFSTA